MEFYLSFRFFMFCLILGVRGMFVLVEGPERETVGFVPLSLRVELHDLTQDYRGTSVATVPKRFRVATRPENETDLELGQKLWNTYFQATVYEDEDEEEEEAAQQGEEKQDDAAANDLDLEKELK